MDECLECGTRLNLAGQTECQCSRVKMGKEIIVISSPDTKADKVPWCEKFYRDLSEKQKPLNKDIQVFINDNFMDLI